MQKIKRQKIKLGFCSTWWLIDFCFLRKKPKKFKQKNIKQKMQQNELLVIEHLFGTNESLHRCALEVNKHFGIIYIANIIVGYGNQTEGFDYFQKMYGRHESKKNTRNNFRRSELIFFKFCDNQVCFDLIHCDEHSNNIKIKDVWEIIVSRDVSSIQSSLQSKIRTKKSGKFLATFILDELTKLFIFFVMRSTTIY